MEQSPDGLDAYRLQLQSYRAFARETFADERTRLLLGNQVLPCRPCAGRCRRGWRRHWICRPGSAIRKQRGQGRHGQPAARLGPRASGAWRGNPNRRQGGKILVENKKAVAVLLSSKETIDAGELIASSVDPRQLILQLLGEQVVGPAIAGKLRRYEPGESALIVYLALDRPVQFKSGEAVGRSVYVHPVPSLEFLSRQFVEAAAVDCRPTHSHLCATNPLQLDQGAGRQSLDQARRSAGSICHSW